MGDNYYENYINFHNDKLIDVRCLNDHSVVVITDKRVAKYVFDKASNKLVHLANYKYEL